MKTISAIELKRKKENQEAFQLIDVREAYEFKEYNIEGINIPLDLVLSSTSQFAIDMPIIFCCQTGKRAAAIVHTIDRKLNLENVYCLEGGILAYQDLEK